MLERVLLDANAILNAAFVPQSWSRLVVSRLMQEKRSIFIGSESRRESFEKATAIAERLRKSQDPIMVIETFIQASGAIAVEPSAVPIDAAIPAHDHHVVQEAIASHATIFTSDTQLWTTCRATGYPVVWPLEAVQHLDGLSLATTAFGVAPGRSTGSVFTRVFPGAWAGSKNIGQFTVVEFPGRLWLHYCTHRQAWVVEMPEVGRVELGLEMAADQLQTVSVSWEAKHGLRLRCAATEAIVERRLPRPLGRDLDGGAAIGHRADNQHFWNGHIKVCVMNDRPIGSRGWSLLRAPSELTPNPFDSDRLEQAIRTHLQ